MDELQSSDTPREAAQTAPPSPVAPPAFPAVQRVPRKVLLAFGGVAVFLLWAAAFLTAPPKAPNNQPPNPSAVDDEDDRRRDLKAFLDQTRQQAASPAAPAYPSAALPPAYPEPAGGPPFPEYPQPTIPPSPGEEDFLRRSSPPAAAPDPLIQALRSPLVPPAFRTSAPTSSSSPEPPAPPFPAGFDLQSLGDLTAASAATGLTSATTTSTAPARAKTPTPVALPVYDLAPTADRVAPQQILRKGAIIPAVLETAVNSDLPGQVTALVARDVYDTATASTLLISQGARLVGRFESAVTYGQRRLFVVWTDIVTPGGRRYQLPDLPGADAGGAPGLSGRTNNHTVRLLTGALLLSLVSAGAQLSQPANYGGATYRPPTAGEVAAGALGQRLGEVSSGIIDRELKVPPTITIPAGTRFIVPVTADIAFPIP
jgi:type IV secretory pathway VirB10-like protein